MQTGQKEKNTVAKIRVTMEWRKVREEEKGEGRKISGAIDR